MRAKQLIIIMVFCTFSNLLSQNDTLNQTAADGFKQGYWREYEEWDGKNQLIAEGRYADNLKTGKWTEYYANGNVKSHKEYQKGKTNGKCFNFHPNGSISESGTIKDDKWVGESSFYYPTSTNAKHSLTFNDEGKKQGKQSYYYNTGVLLTNEYFTNGKGDSSISYTQTGKICERFYPIEHDQGVKMTAGYKMSTLNGRTLSYNESGKLSSDISYHNGKREGIIILYYENGNKKFQTEYKDGRMINERMCFDINEKPINGEYLTYYNNKVKEREGNCINGKPEGEFKVYDSTGRISIIANYKNGKPHGLTYYYNHNNLIYKTEKYNDGNFIEEIAK